MSNTVLKYEISGGVGGGQHLPFRGSGKRHVEIDLGKSVSADIVTIPNDSPTVLNITIGLGNYPDLFIIIPSVDGVLTWCPTIHQANNAGVMLRANFPFLISNPHVPTYSDSATYSTEVPTDSGNALGNWAQYFVFYQNSGDTATVQIFATGDGNDA